MYKLQEQQQIEDGKTLKQRKFPPKPTISTNNSQECNKNNDKPDSEFIMFEPLYSSAILIHKK